MSSEERGDISPLDDILISDGYDVSLMKINGRFSYDRTSQRDFPFYTEIRELDLSSRVFVGDESKAVKADYNKLVLILST